MMNRKWIVCLLLTIMSFAFAEDQSTDQPILYYSDDCDIKIIPAAGPMIRKKWNPFLTADFVYWTARQGGMSYAISGGVVNNPRKGRMYDPDWTWDPGFKVGLGFNLPHDGWDIYAQYTWFHTDVYDSTEQNPTTSTLLPYWIINGSTNTLANARAAWDISFSDVTLELARNSYLSQYLKLRIHMGLEGSWINQDYRARMTEVNGAQNRLDLKQDYWGVGLRAGLNTAWQFTKNLSFFGDLAIATLWGQFDLARREYLTQFGATNTTFYTAANPHTLEPVIDLHAGLRWETWLNRDRLHFLMQAGWEHQLYLLHNEVIKNLGEPDHTGDLILQGLTVKARLDF